VWLRSKWIRVGETCCHSEEGERHPARQQDPVIKFLNE
jgi:hypothetical protein